MELFGALHSFFTLFYFFMIGLSVYCLFLFIKLARRGIKALDIYIGKNNQSNSGNEEIEEL
jgi:hypothetical protein